MGCWQRMQNVVMDSVPKSSVSRTSFLPADGYVGSTTYTLHWHGVIGTSPDRDLIEALAQPSHLLLSHLRRVCAVHHLLQNPVSTHLWKAGVLSILSYPQIGLHPGSVLKCHRCWILLIADCAVIAF